MMKKFAEYKGLDLPAINAGVLDEWEKDDTFAQSLDARSGRPEYVFYEGPPSANGMPGIHHVMARAIKDVFCRYMTQKNYLVRRKAGWDTHGLPVELGVEKMLGITKENIGKTISVADYNAACRREVMKYTKEWETLTAKIGYWVDMQHPYVTYDNRYIETLWHLLKDIYKKGLLYKGYTIQPYSPAAGTGLSSHELNQPGCYRDVKDTTCVAMFRIKTPSGAPLPWTLTDAQRGNLYFLAWTTTPWTLPSNTALAVGKNIEYALVDTFNPYSGKPATVVLAKPLLDVYFPPKNAGLPFDAYKQGDKDIPYAVLATCKGESLVGVEYEQLIPWVNPRGEAFRVIAGDFVTTDDGTGIVHIAPTFGADDYRAAKLNSIAPMLLTDANGNARPMVDLTGKFYRIDDLDAGFVKENVNVGLYKEYAGRYVKNAYDPALTDNDESLDVAICMLLKQQGLVFKIEKHVHAYPHCWRTDKPVLYYPLDSWFIRTTAVKDRLIALNETINWKPESTGSGRFGKWLENLQDWNLSRSRYWGTPLPIWRTEDGTEEICIGSIDELRRETEKAVAQKFMDTNPLNDTAHIDLHRPYVDDFVLVSPSGKPMRREPDLIDVWFDSGAMPFAQQGIEHVSDAPSFPADFIAEGVDQTRGWFFTLHAIAVMVKDSVAFRNVVSNGLVLDKFGNKMSKRLGNAVEPFAVLAAHGADALRWYMLTNAQPWDNLKFDLAGVEEVKRKFFGTLYNTYSFFALYANVDGYSGNEKEIAVADRPDIDRWIVSLLHSLTAAVDAAYRDYDVTLAGRLIQDFVCDHLSNWYVRLNRKRFWGGGLTPDKLAAYQTLYACLETVAVLAAPIAPFFMERLFGDLNTVTQRRRERSVHLVLFPECNEQWIDKQLENQMDMAQHASSMVLALRRKVNIKVRQPLQKMMIPLLDQSMQHDLEAVRQLVLNEVNVKEMEFLHDTTGVIVKKIKPNFKTLGKRYGKQMKEIAAAVSAFTQQQIAAIEAAAEYPLDLPSGAVALLPDDVEITSEDLPGWLVASEGKLTIALDVTVTDVLRREGIARELVNRIQNLRKDSGFDVTDKIAITLQRHETIEEAVTIFKDFIATQTLAVEITLADEISAASILEIDDLALQAAIVRV
ncbi:MAG: isoleucine--tRNA ligase [Prevotellaceae bacterium]|jgi:isoleucyl-tRNA synthetase|nr:isoleucine--tRNA ligase [Prevotellaceae bacterium]